MNIAEILKDCPKGTKLYSPLFGEVTFIEVNDTKSQYLISVRTDVDGRYEWFTELGTFISQCPGECMLFPSKDNRDWSTIKVPKKECKFKPFDKVLVRDKNSNKWSIDLFLACEESREEGQ